MLEKKRVLVRFGYGGDFASYPLSPVGRSVESVLVGALGKVFGVNGDARTRARALHWESASRTDRGVGAVANVGAFDVPHATTNVEKRISGACSIAARRRVWVTAWAEVRPGFSPRRSALAREYRFFLPSELVGDVDIARRALSVFLGRHDFSRFSTRDRSRTTTTICTVRTAELAVNGEVVVFRYVADRFLWNMVRRMTAATIAVSNSKLEIGELEAALEGRGEYRAPGMRAEGLYLWRVEFDPEIENGFVSLKRPELPALSAQAWGWAEALAATVRR